MSSKKSGLFIGGLLLGSAIGTLTGLLIAPRTGKQTQKLLKKSVSVLPELTEDLSTSLEFQATRLSHSATNSCMFFLDRCKEAIAAGLEASQKERETLSETQIDNSQVSAVADGKDK